MLYRPSKSNIKIPIRIFTDSEHRMVVCYIRNVITRLAYLNFSKSLRIIFIPRCYFGAVPVIPFSTVIVPIDIRRNGERKSLKFDNIEIRPIRLKVIIEALPSKVLWFCQFFIIKHFKAILHLLKQKRVKLGFRAIISV